MLPQRETMEFQQFQWRLLHGSKHGLKASNQRNLAHTTCRELLLLRRSLAASTLQPSVLERIYLVAYWLFFLWGVGALFSTVRGRFSRSPKLDLPLLLRHETLARTQQQAHTRRYATCPPFAIQQPGQKRCHIYYSRGSFCCLTIAAYHIAGKHKTPAY